MILLWRLREKLAIFLFKFRTKYFCSNAISIRRTVFLLFLRAILTIANVVLFRGLLAPEHKNWNKFKGDEREMGGNERRQQQTCVCFRNVHLNLFQHEQYIAKFQPYFVSLRRFLFASHAVRELNWEMDFAAVRHHKLIILWIFIYFHVIDMLLPMCECVCSCQQVDNDFNDMCTLRWCSYYFNGIFLIAIKCCCSIHFIFHHNISHFIHPIRSGFRTHCKTRAHTTTPCVSKLVSRNMD